MSPLESFIAFMVFIAPWILFFCGMWRDQND
jgi:hypothetical protein